MESMRRQFVLVIFTFVKCFVFGSSGDDEWRHPNRCLVNIIGSGVSYRGLHKASVLKPNCKYCSYTDIKYAEAKRFKKPDPYTPPRGIYNATEDKKMCPQIPLPRPDDPNPTNFLTDEDCLYLNVFVPQTYEGIEQRPKAVLVFIHGGGFLGGSKSSSEFGPDFLIPHDIIVVTVNYRLSVYGFISLCLPECGGNMGLRDQLAALEWVQKNIRFFGGDPNRVTVSGQSAGAISVYALAVSPLSKGLFSGAIMESPVITDRFKSQVDIYVKKVAFQYTIKLVVYLKYKGDLNDRWAILQFLRGFTTLDLLKGFYQFLSYLAQTDDEYLYDLEPFGPGLDACVPDAVLPHSLEVLGKNIGDLRILFGLTSGDGDFYAEPNFQPIADYVLSHLGLFIRGIEPSLARTNETLQQAVTKTLERYNPNGKNNDINLAVQLVTYFCFDNLYEQLAIFQKPYHDGFIWLYLFDYERGAQNYKNLLMGRYAKDVQGASHVAEVDYLYYVSFFNPKGQVNKTREELNLTCKMTSWWASFVKTGNPNAESYYNNYRCTGVNWGPTTPARESYLRIGSQYSDEAKFLENKRIFQHQRDFFHKTLPRMILHNGN